MNFCHSLVKETDPRCKLANATELKQSTRRVLQIACK